MQCELLQIDWTGSDASVLALDKTLASVMWQKQRGALTSDEGGSKAVTFFSFFLSSLLFLALASVNFSLRQIVVILKHRTTPQSMFGLGQHNTNWQPEDPLEAGRISKARSRGILYQLLRCSSCRRAQRVASSSASSGTSQSPDLLLLEVGVKPGLGVFLQHQSIRAKCYQTQWVALLLEGNLNSYDTTTFSPLTFYKVFFPTKGVDWWRFC